MNSSFIIYPIVTYPQIVDLFHAILFWRYEQKLEKGVRPDFWSATFDTVWSLLEMNRVLPKARIARLRGNRELCRLFLKDTQVVAQQDDRGWEIILKTAELRRFCVRIGNRELTAGNTVNHLELCSRTRIFITRFGVRTAPPAVRRIEPLFTKQRFLTTWATYTARNKWGLGEQMKARNAELDDEIWGGVPEEAI